MRTVFYITRLFYLFMKIPSYELTAFNPNLIERETARVEIFSDAVFAIVITLLILDIHVPEDYTVDPVMSLIETGPKFMAYVLSFLTIGVYWISHHNMFNFIKKTNRYMMWYNLVFLMCVTLIPFPTKLISEFSTEPVSGVAYGLIIILINCTMYAFWAYVSRNHRLVSKELPEEVIEYIRWQILLGIILCIFGITASFIVPAYSILIYGAIILRLVIPNNIKKMVAKVHHYQGLFEGKISRFF